MLYSRRESRDIMAGSLGQERKLNKGVRNILRLAWCSMGAAAGIGLALWIVDGLSSPLLLASLGGSSVFLFGLTRTPTAQPRALFGGHLGGALIGIFCYQAFGDSLWVCVLAVALALVFMLATRTLHPPAGANPLIMVHGHAGLAALWQLVGLGILILSLVAVVWSRLLPGMVHYPIHWFEESPPGDIWGAWTE